MPNLTSIAQVKLSVVDASSNQPITRDTGAISYPGSTGIFCPFAQTPAAAGTAMTLDTAGVQRKLLYVRNLASDGGAPIEVWTKIIADGGGAVLKRVAALDPGGVFLQWNKVYGGAGVGVFSDFTVISPTGTNVPFEYYFA